MCTATYLPINQRGDVILTFSRDEQPQRSPKSLTRDSVNGLQICFPRDTMQGGTWLAAADNGTWVCLLNGAFAKHQRQPPYRRSRGLVLLDVFQYDSFQTFTERYNFIDIEPFTILSYKNKCLFELRWDAHNKHLKKLENDLPHIWSSATLYPPEWQVEREAWFETWQRQVELQPTTAAELIMDFHYNGGEKQPEYGLIMQRPNGVQTVSISQIVVANGTSQLRYHELCSKVSLVEYFKK